MNRPKKSLNPNKLMYMASAVDLQGCPPGNQPEFAIVGRSNAGKSTLINGLAGSKIALTSATPGKTRMLNFYSAPRYCLVDMPGYGFAARTGAEQVSWQEMIEPYLGARENLAGLIIVMDIRRDWSQDEENLIRWIAPRGIPCIVALTKADKLSRGEGMNRRQLIQRTSGVEHILITSSLEKRGFIELEELAYTVFVKGAEAGAGDGERADMKCVGIIPARYGSTRFPGKPLTLINGQPLLKWVIDGARTSKKLAEIAVATDDNRIAQLARECGVKALMTDSELPTGTDRIYQAAKQLELEDADVIVNIQGDEPLIEGSLLDKLVEPFSDRELQMATLGRALDEESLRSPNTAKIVLNKKNEAMYFSRLAIPYTRVAGEAPYAAALKHIGVYAYRKSFLREFCAEKPAAVELAESLEQLRALYLGARIKVVHVTHDSWGVDTPDDVLKIERLMRERTNAR